MDLEASNTYRIAVAEARRETKEKADRAKTEQMQRAQRALDEMRESVADLLQFDSYGGAYRAALGYLRIVDVEGDTVTLQSPEWASDDEPASAKPGRDKIQLSVNQMDAISTEPLHVMSAGQMVTAELKDTPKFQVAANLHALFDAFAKQSES